ncbi:hypothetical protein [Mucilaginibacter pedocola]|uniref:Uncharacterized protein n=1 Tax=Mucilaginibacter pedocola TaxID=1792845 RepID=A0A1S9PFC7_9SPHI|nr:hypothetical protein [Mucilaginibacter pedocola]OOQ59298.1 hypothetical protein BC343_28685 [Mucilaginibacter pedocola]
MFYLIIFSAAVFFIAHVTLLFTSFKGAQLAGKRYFYSHLTLWLAGILVFILASTYSGSGRSGFLDYFDTSVKRGMILLFTAALSFVAHNIVQFAVLPLLKRK